MEEFANQSYDYVIVGVGMAGLVVAARLCENPRISVAVNEGGTDRMDDQHNLNTQPIPTLI